MPDPTPTAEQIETTREAARLLSLPYTAALIDLLTDEQWVRQLATNVEWDAARHDDVKIGGRVQINPQLTREFLTDETRERLGLSPLFSWTDSSAGQSESTPTKVIW